MRSKGHKSELMSERRVGQGGCAHRDFWCWFTNIDQVAVRKDNVWRLLSSRPRMLSREVLLFCCNVKLETAVVVLILPC